MRTIGDINIYDNLIKYIIDYDINIRAEQNTHLEQSQDVDDNINYFNLRKDEIDENIKDRAEYNTHPEESQDVDDNIHYYPKQEIT